MPPPYYGSATNHFACGSTLREDRGYIYLPHMHSFRQWEAYHSGENICGVFIGWRPLLSLASFELATEFPFVRRNIHVQGKEYVPSSSWYTPKTLLKPQNDHTTYFFQIHVKLRRRNRLRIQEKYGCQFSEELKRNAEEKSEESFNNIICAYWEKS